MINLSLTSPDLYRLLKSTTCLELEVPPDRSLRRKLQTHKVSFLECLAEANYLPSRDKRGDESDYLEPQYVGEKIVEAIQTGQRALLLPWNM